MLVKRLGQVAYSEAYQAMQDFTSQRSLETPDELWLCEHPPVFTQGLAGLAVHVHHAGDIPVIATNRGGQVTYHGPGQVMAYPMVNLQRAGYFVKEHVYRLEEAVIRTLAHNALTGPATPGDPFKGLGKISALGIKVSRHCTYHGLALNVKMDLEPFQRINPCGYAGLQTVDLFTIGVNTTWEEAAEVLASKLTPLLSP